MDSEKSESDFLTHGSEESVGDSEKRDSLGRNAEGFIGVLDVYIHEARDIHNICIYQKQDVYAKLCLTSDPERTVSTRIINGGGRNPVFDENVRLNVQKIDSTSLKIEIWMLSRVRNYLEDQLLGFTLIPLSDVLIKNGKLAKEFSLSSSDLFHSPAGFVQLTLTYSGESPEVLEIPASHIAVLNDDTKDSGIDDDVPIPFEIFDKIEFLDPEMMNENEQMASEYFGIPCPDLDCKISEQPCPDPDGHDHVQTTCDQEATFDAETHSDSVNVPIDSSSSVSETSSFAGLFKNQDEIPELEAKNASEINVAVPETATAALNPPLIKVAVEQETKVVQEEIVEMYKKSMQEFTEALAKMKLPVVEMAEAPVNDEDADGSSRNSSHGEEKPQPSKDSEPSPRVFYGSGAFF